MMQILDTLFIKRFNLPAGTDIETYENGTNKVKSCLCGNFNHASCILKGKGKQRKI